MTTPNSPTSPDPRRPLTPLCLIAKKFETDKGGRHLRYNNAPCERTHEYTPIYWDVLSGRRDKVGLVLEIGINSGASLRMWEEFFPYATVWGIDNDTNYLISEGNIRSLLADQGSVQSLTDVMRVISDRPDLIVDDGSHVPEHQIVSMVTLLPYLAADGIYIIEDCSNTGRVLQDLPAGFQADVLWTEPGSGLSNYPEPLIFICRDNQDPPWQKSSSPE